MYLKETSLRFELLLYGLIIILFPAIAQAILPSPTTQQSYSYPPSTEPVLSQDPAQARPIGVGAVTGEHDLTLKIGIDSFSSPVDVYFVLYAPAVFPEFLLFLPGGSLAPLSEGWSPWKAGITGPVNEAIWGTIPLSLIPSSDYIFALLVVPAGTEATDLGNSFYLWMTSVKNLRAADVGEKGVSLFGGDAEAAASVVLALGNGYLIGDVVGAIMEGTLTADGGIGPDTAGTKVRFSEIKLPPICDPSHSLQECRQGIIDAFRHLQSDFISDGVFLGGSYELRSFVTAFTLYLSGLGYSGAQIHEALMDRLFCHDNCLEIDFTDRPGFPIGGIVKRSFWDDEVSCLIEPELTPADLFSDIALTSKDFDIGNMEFPAYYTGTGTVHMTYSNPNRGSVECSWEILYAARAGGIGFWDGRLKVYSEKYPTTSSSGDLECVFTDWSCGVAEGLYDDVGIYTEDFSTDTYTGSATVDFTAVDLWGYVTGTQTIPVYGGDQVKHLEWVFKLRKSTEEAYNEIVGTH